jgi:hypothetical protein
MKKIFIFAVFLFFVALLGPMFADSYYNSYDQGVVKDKLAELNPKFGSINLISKNRMMYDVWMVVDSNQKNIFYRYSHGEIVKDTSKHICHK